MTQDLMLSIIATECKSACAGEPDLEARLTPEKNQDQSEHGSSQ